MNFKNMKIEINEAQPLDEVVIELERLSFFKGCWWTGCGDIKTIEADAETKHLVDYTSCHIEKRHGELTTLAELKEMQCKI